MSDLRAVDVLGGAVRMAGLVELEPTSAGIVLHRMPAWARVQHNDATLSLLESVPTGARIEMVTDATAIELDAHLTLVQVGDVAGPTASFDLVVDGTPVATEETRTGTLIVVDPVSRGFDIRPGAKATISFGSLPAGEKTVEIWLPHAAAVRLVELRTNGAVRAAEPVGRRWVHYGSSISHCLEAASPLGTWPTVAARLAGVDLMSFAFAGQCQLDPFVGRMIAAEPADLISLKLGINIVNADSMRERTFVPAIHGLLDTIRDRHPETPIVLITPITCSVAEDHPGPTVGKPGGKVSVIERPVGLEVGALTLTRIRELEAGIVAARQAAADANLHLLAGPELFGPADDDDLPDGLHPNAAGYRRMGERFHHMIFEKGPFAAR